LLLRLAPTSSRDAACFALFMMGTEAPRVMAGSFWRSGVFETFHA
jgi:hypothetical protein